MLKRLFQHSGIYALSDGLSRVAMLAILPVYTAVLGPSELGLLEVVTITTALVTLSATLQITQGVARFYLDAGTPEARIGYASTALWFSVAAYGLVAVAAVAGRGVFARWLFSPDMSRSAYHLAIGSIVAVGAFTISSNQLKWQLQPLKHASASLLRVALAYGIAVYLVVRWSAGVQGVLWGLLAGNVAAAAVALSWTRHSYRWRFDWRKLSDMLRFSLPKVPAGLAVFVACFIDRICVREMMSLADVGRYAVAFRIASVTTVLTVGFQGAFMPLVYAGHRRPETPLAIARTHRYVVALALAMLAGLSVLGPSVLRLLTSPEYLSVAPLLPWLAAGAIFHTLSLFAPGLALARKTWQSSLILATGAAINTLLNLLLIPRLGLAGAAAATLAGAATAWGLFMWRSQAHYPVPHRWRSLAIIACLVTLVLLIEAATRPWRGPMPLGDFAARLATLSIVAGLLAGWLLCDAGERAAVRRLLQIRPAPRPRPRPSPLEHADRFAQHAPDR